MKYFSYKRVLSPFLFALAVGSMLNCGGGGGDEEDFTSHGDALVMTSLVGIWKGTSAAGKPYALTICEDLDPNAQRDSLAATCGTKHQIEGNGRGKTEAVSMDPGGCGGCDYDNSAYMVGTLEGSDIAPTPVNAQFSMNGDANGPALPYAFVLADSAYKTAEDLRQTITMRGNVMTAGYIDVSLFTYETPDQIPPPYDAGNGLDASQDSDASQEADAGDVDSGEPDASDLDASADDASAPDAGSPVPAPTATSSSSPAPTTSSSGGFHVSSLQSTTIRLARVADTACPAP
ncbi:MAG: hypothetical protein ABI183_14925 [Polyangiaceae bacterium]